MTEVLAAVARAPHEPMELATLRLDDPRPGEVLIELRAAGICHSDLAGRDQHMPFALPGVLGHEGAGIVRAVGADVTKVAVGDRVVISQAFCGACKACRAGRVTGCPEVFSLGLGGVRSDGSPTLTDASGAAVGGGYMGQSSWATYSLAREPNVVRIPEDLPWEVASPFACGVQTGAAAVVSALAPDSSSSIVIFGAGTVGLSALMGAAYLGCATIIAVDPVASRRELALELGATHVVDPTTEDVVAVVQELTGGGVDYAVEASGSTAAGPLALQSLATQGTCMMLGVVPFGTTIEVDWIGLVSGKTVFGAPFGGNDPATTIELLLQMRAAGRLPVEKLVRTYPFADVEKAIADMESGTTIKPVLLFE